MLRPGGRLLIADFRPPRNRIANYLISAQSGHEMRHNPIGHLAGLIAQAGFHVTGSGDSSHRLRYVQAQRPTASSGSEMREDPQAADHDEHGDGDHPRGLPGGKIVF